MPSLLELMLDCADRAEQRAYEARQAQRRAEKHYHRCPVQSCGVVWSHASADFANQKEHTAGHQCPVCEAEEYFKCDPLGRPI